LIFPLLFASKWRHVDIRVIV